MVINYIRNLRVRHGSEKVADSHQRARLFLCSPSVLGCVRGKRWLTGQLPVGGGIGLSCGRLRGGPPNHVYLELQNVASLVNKVSVN